MTRTITPGQIRPGMTIRATRKRDHWTTMYEGKVREVDEGNGVDHSFVRFETSVSRACIISCDFTIEVLREPDPPEPQGLWSTVSWYDPVLGHLVTINTGKDWILLDAGKDVYTKRWAIPWGRVITLSGSAPLTIHDTTEDKEVLDERPQDPRQGPRPAHGRRDGSLEHLERRLSGTGETRNPE